MNNVRCTINGVVTECPQVFDNPAIPIAFMIGFVAVILLTIVGFWKVFTKAGKPGWASIVPFYNYVVLLQIIGRPWWWLLLMLIPIVNIAIAIIIYKELGEVFGKGIGFIIGIVLLPVVFIPILGFDKSQYKGPLTATPIPPVPPQIPTTPTV